MEAHARKVIGANWGVDDPNILEFHVVQSADNLQVCSCPACRTPRNNDWAPNDERLTMAERRMNESFREQMEAVNEAEF
jgi:hypothetical protein